LEARDNVIMGNGYGNTRGSWGASAGISISSSPDCVIERNLIIGNREGFNFREQNRSTSRIDDVRKHPVWNHREVVRNNVLAYNSEAQVWGWFDVGDARHWPAGMSREMVGAGARPAPVAGVPAGLTLEKLEISFASNLYATHPGQGLFHWGVYWKPNRRYGSLEEVRAELGFTVGSRVANPGFADLRAMDLRVPADSPARRLRCYPRGEVPGVRLGVFER
jgi:hypothetical protein